MSRPRGCNGKTRRSRDDARRTAHRLRHKGLLTASYYKCKSCGHYHVTSGAMGFWLQLTYP